MIQFFRKFRKKFLLENQFTKYLLYAAGEIVLVVVGILIAIQINNWNREKALLSEEKEVYDILITDLKRDSEQFQRYKEQYTLYLDTYFMLNKMSREGGNFNDMIPDFIVSNIEFNPVVQKNTLQVIEKLRSQHIRDKLNRYFRILNLATQATDEFNATIVDKSRPFFLEENNIFDNDYVFNSEDRTFPPFLGVSVIDTVALSRTFQKDYFTPILSSLRMSLGFYLASLDRAIDANQTLIEELAQARDN
jgi:hypothetical protein